MPDGIDTDAGATPAEKATPATEPSKAEAPKADQLGEGGKRALEAEREARKELERQLSQMRDGLAQVFGQKASGKASTDDVLSSLSEQVSEMKRENAVLRVASANGITDQEDIDLLRSATDEDAMTRLAGRLAAKANGADAKPGTPKPDLTQGSKGEPIKGSTADQFASAFKDVFN